MTPRFQRPTTDRLHVTDFAPWAGQRMVLRSQAQTRVVVGGRQIGKTTTLGHELFGVGLARPGSTSVVIAPTTKPFLTNLIDRMRIVAQTLPGVAWKAGRFELANGSKIEFLSAESVRGEVGRSLTVDGLLAFEEAGFIADGVHQAALKTTLVGNGRVLIVTTPAGKNWVHREFTNKDPKNARFRLRATDSPFTNQERLRTLRSKVSPERAAADLDAMFVENLRLAFPDLGRLFVRSFPDRARDTTASLRYSLGVDLAYEKDWTVATLMNCFGEARIVARWQHKNYMDAADELAEVARDHQALVVLDVGPGGGVGLPIQHRLERDFGLTVLPVHTAQQEAKTKLVEQLRGDVRWEKVHVQDDPYDDAGHELALQLRHELSMFQAVLRITRGKSWWVYEAPALEGEHDDCVISLALANWGRLHLTGGAPGATEPDVDPDQLVAFNRRLAERLNRPDLGGGWVDMGSGLFMNPWRTP